MEKRSNVNSVKAFKLEQALLSIEENLDHICNVHRLITNEQKMALLKDIKYLLLDNIAQEVKLDFYDPIDKINVMECFYTADGLREKFTVVDQNRDMSGVNVTIDVFFKFTDAFLSLGEEVQKILLRNTDFEWYPDSNANIY